MGNLTRSLHVLLVSFAVLVQPACSGLGEKGNETAPSAGGPTVGPSEQKPELVPDEILVKFKPSVSQERIQALAEKHSMTIKEVIKDINWYVLKIQGSRSVSEVVNGLKQDPEVEAVELQGFMGIQ